MRAGDLRRALRPLALRVSHLIGWALIDSTEDEQGIQNAQVTARAGEVHAGVPRFQQYGLTSRPLPGAEAVLASLGGIREHTVILAVDDRRYRIQGLEEGEVAIYTDEGDAIHLKRGGTIQVTASALFEVTAPAVRFDGDLAVTGDVLDQSEGTGVNMATMRAVFNSHTHTENNIPGGQTQPPTQQMGGAGGGSDPGGPTTQGRWRIGAGPPDDSEGEAGELYLDFGSEILRVWGPFDQGTWGVLPFGLTTAHEAAYDHDSYDGHLLDANNPHAVTAADVGADPAGTAGTVAAAAVSTHEEAFDHSGFQRKAFVPILHGQWVLDELGKKYALTVEGTIHELGAAILVQVQEEIAAGPIYQTIPRVTSATVDASGDIVLEVPATPDERFDGRLAIIG